MSLRRMFMKSQQSQWRLLVMASVSSLFFLGAPEGFLGVAQATDGKRTVEQIQGAFMDLADRVKPAVVNIAPVSSAARSPENPRERNPNSSGTGSGVIVDKRWLI